MGGSCLGKALQPLYGADRAALEVVVEAQLDELRGIGDSVEVDVDQGQPRWVFEHDIEGGAGDAGGPSDPEAARQTLHEAGLAGTERPAQLDDVSRLQ